MNIGTRLIDEWDTARERAFETFEASEFFAQFEGSVVPDVVVQTWNPGRRTRVAVVAALVLLTLVLAMGARRVHNAKSDELLQGAIEAYEKQSFGKALALSEGVKGWGQDNAGAWLVQSWCHFQNEDFQKCLEAAEQSLLSGPSMSQRALALSSRAQAKFHLGDRVAAYADFDEALQVDPDASHVLRARASCNQSARFFHRAVSDYSDYLELEPKDLIVLEERGECYRQLGKYDEAIADLSRVLAHEPRIPQALSRRAYSYLELGEAELALADATTLLESHPDLGFPYKLRGLAYVGLRDYYAALADFEKSVHLDPSSVEARKHLKKTLVWIGRGSEAFEGADNDLADWLATAMTLEEYEKYEQALPWVEKVLAERNLPEEVEASGRKIRFRILAGLNRHSDAEEDAEFFIEREPLSPENLNTLAWIYASKGRYNEAKDLATQSIRLRADSVNSHDTLGYILVGLGQYEEALKAYNRAIALGEEPASYLGRSEAYRRMGELELAMLDEAKARDIDPAATLDWSETEELTDRWKRQVVESLNAGS